MIDLKADEEVKNSCDTFKRKIINSAMYREGRKNWNTENQQGDWPWKK